MYERKRLRIIAKYSFNCFHRQVCALIKKINKNDGKVTWNILKTFEFFMTKFRCDIIWWHITKFI